jgi:chromosomal replication initiation ATPase DnaA
MTSHTRTIQKAVAEYFGIKLPELTGPDRSATLSRARRVGMALCYYLLSLSYVECADAFGGRDHSTAMRAIRIARLVDDPTFIELQTLLRTQLPPGLARPTGLPLA